MEDVFEQFGDIFGGSRFGGLGHKGLKDALYQVLSEIVEKSPYVNSFFPLEDYYNIFIGRTTFQELRLNADARVTFLGGGCAHFDEGGWVNVSSSPASDKITTLVSSTSHIPAKWISCGIYKYMSYINVLRWIEDNGFVLYKKTRPVVTTRWIKPNVFSATIYAIAPDLSFALEFEFYDENNRHKDVGNSIYLAHTLSRIKAMTYGDWEFKKDIIVKAESMGFYKGLISQLKTNPYFNFMKNNP